MTNRRSVATSYFEKIYASAPDADPWGFASRWYERRKYDITLASLPRERYRRAFEPGAANGVLTHRLAARCDELVACELLPSVADRARERVLGQTHVDVRVMTIPDEWPEGCFDLVVLSEIVYYLGDDGLARLFERLYGSLERGAHVVAVHYTGETDYPLTGREAHAYLDASAALERLVHHEDEEFILDVYERGDAAP